MGEMKFSQSEKRQIFNANAKLALKFAAQPAETPNQEKEVGEGSATLEGYALTWNTLSDDRGGYKVRLAPNSATFTTPTYAIWHHDFSKPLATTANGSLRLFSDDIGVRVEIDLPDTTTGRDAAELVADGIVGGMSFSMIPGEWEESEEGGEKIMTATRYLVDEVTITAIPSFQSTSIEVQGEDDGTEAGDGDYAAQLATESVRLEQLKLALYSL